MAAWITRWRLASVGMAEKRAARRAAPEPFVHRIDPSGGGGLRSSLTVAAMVYTPTLLVLLIGAVVEVFGSFFANHWLTVAIVGSLNTVVVLVIKAASIAEKNEADSEGVSLILDATGVYLGGRQPRRIPWRDISEVRLTTLTTTHIRTGRTAIHHYADFEITGSPRARRTGLDAAKLSQIRTTVTRHAPNVTITILDQRR